jgi:hypothetical protein
VVSLTDLSNFLAYSVPDETFNQQHPTFTMPTTVQDYPIASVVR